jgi:hypothetical protein
MFFPSSSFFFSCQFLLVVGPDTTEREQPDRVFLTSRCLGPDGSPLHVGPVEWGGDESWPRGWSRVKEMLDARD